MACFCYDTNRCFLSNNTPAGACPAQWSHKPARRFKRMAKCEFCDKGVVFGIQVSHSQSSLEAQREAREGDRQRHPEARLCVHSLPPFGQSYPRCLIQLRQKSTGLCLCFFLAHRCGLWYTVPIFQPETTKPALFWLRTMEEEVLWHLSRQSN